MPLRTIHPSLPTGLALMATFYLAGFLALGSWSVHPSIPIGIGVLLGLYAAAVGPLGRRYGWGPPVEQEQWIAFVAGCEVLFLALTGPIHDLSDSYLFSAHMVQHLFITLLVPPLLLIGTPDWLVRVLLRPAGLAWLAARIGSPPVAFAIFNGTLAAWHLPVLYNSTLLRLETHILEHLLFVVTACIGWWPVLAPAKELRARIEFQMIYLLLIPFPMKVIGMLITLSDSLLYPAYAIAPRIAGIGTLTDQRIGGLLMWVPAGFVFWLVLGVHFAAWYRESHPDRERPSEGGATAS
jgi:putative membrane protein